MKILDKIFGKEPSPEEPPLPIKVGPQQIRMLSRLLRGYRFKARSRVYKKRQKPVRFIDGKAVLLSFHAARLHDIYTSMREANEIRRVTRERQLEARAT